MTVLRFGLTPKMKPVSPKRAAVVAGLDIGTSKIVCMIARLEPQAPQDVLRRRSHGVRILGFAHTAASGMKAGSVVDLVEAEEMVRQAIDIAESMAGVQLESVVVSLSGGRLGSERFVANIELAGGAVTDGDIAPRAGGGRAAIRCATGAPCLHSLPIGYALDAATGIREPRGMLGPPLRRRHAHGHRRRGDRAQPDAHGRAQPPDGRGHGGLALYGGSGGAGRRRSRSGRCRIDLGAGTTTLAVFSGGRFVHADGFALGGHHVTMDLARGLNTRIADAERIKAIYGSVLSGGSDERDMITVPPVGDDEREPPQFVSRAALVRIIKPRVEEILEMVRDRLARVAVCGRAARARGVDRRRQPTGRHRRFGRAHPAPAGAHRASARTWPGLPEAAKGPAFAVAAGLLVYPQAAHLEHFEPRRTRQLMTGTGGYMARVGQWLRESF